MDRTAPSYFLEPYDGNPPEAPAWFTDALNLAPERSSFESQGAKVELLTWGAIGKPGLLFLHGLGGHAEWWSFIAPFFAQNWRCAAISWTGMGGSDHRPEGYSIANFAQEARDALGAAVLDMSDTPPIVIGHSMGGLAGMIAGSRDTRFGGLITIDLPIHLSRDQLSRVKGGSRAQREGRIFPTLTAGLGRFRFSPAQDCVNAFIGDHIARGSLRQVEDGWRWRADPRPVSVEGYSAINEVTKLLCPMAYIYGTESVLVRPENLAVAVGRFAPGTPVIAIPQAGHHIMVDQPLPLVSALRALLACWPGRTALGGGVGGHGVVQEDRY